MNWIVSPFARLALLACIVTTQLPSEVRADNVSTGSENPLNSNSPVSLRTFSGQYAKKKITLTWTCAGNSKEKNFEIERSVSGQTFIKIAAVKGTSSNKYQYTDQYIFQPSYYYRIKIIHEGGDPTYSDPISISQQQTGITSIAIQKTVDMDTMATVPIPRRPVPVKTAAAEKFSKMTIASTPISFKEKLLLEMKAEKAGDLYIELVSADNRVHLTRSFKATAGNNHIELNELDYLPEGDYQVEVKTGKQVVRCKASK